MLLAVWLQQHCSTAYELADLRMLVAALLQIDKHAQRTQNIVLHPEQLHILEHAWQRLQAGEPLAYVVGSQAFLDFEVQVNPATLIPRADTETLALHAITVAQNLAKRFAPLVLWDMGTGSGILAIALKRALPQAEVFAFDRSEQALCIAQSNAQALGLEIYFHTSDWFSALTGQKAHLIVSNPPYIAPNDPHLPALHHEPQSALVAPDEGYADLFHLIDHAPDYLHHGGFLLLEHGYQQAPRVQKRFAQQTAWQAPQTFMDLAQRPRISGAERR